MNPAAGSLRLERESALRLHGYCWRLESDLLVFDYSHHRESKTSPAPRQRFGVNAWWIVRRIAKSNKTVRVGLEARMGTLGEL